MSHTIVFDGYLAHLITVQAENKKISPADYVLSFFGTGCNAPRAKVKPATARIFCPKGCNAPRRVQRSRKAVQG